MIAAKAGDADRGWIWQTDGNISPSSWQNARLAEEFPEKSASRLKTQREPDRRAAHFFIAELRALPCRTFRQMGRQGSDRQTGGGAMPNRSVDVSAWEFAMLGWAFTFLLVALLAAALGFGGTAGAPALVAQVLFVIFILLFLVTVVMRRLRGQGARRRDF